MAEAKAESSQVVPVLEAPFTCSREGVDEGTVMLWYDDGAEADGATSLLPLGLEDSTRVVATLNVDCSGRVTGEDPAGVGVVVAVPDGATGVPAGSDGTPLMEVAVVAGTERVEVENTVLCLSEVTGVTITV